MNFIISLSESLDSVNEIEYDGILVIVDRFIKAERFISVQGHQSAEQLAYLIIRELVAKKGVPESIVSDRDKLFISKFWTSILAKLGIKKKMSTAFHPQTDGQTERLNQTLKQYLRAYINDEQDNWVRLLSTAQLVYNNTTVEVTGLTSREMETGRKNNLSTGSVETGNSAADELGDKILLRQHQLKEDLQILKEKMRTQHGGKERIFNSGNKIYVQTKNLKLKDEMKKLGHTAEGPFRVIRNIKNTFYELKISDFSIHQTFYGVLLTKADPSTPLTKSLGTKVREKKFEVEKVLEERTRREKKEFLIS